MNRDLPAELLFFPKVGMVRIERSGNKAHEIIKDKFGKLLVNAPMEISIYEIRAMVEKYIDNLASA